MKQQGADEINDKFVHLAKKPQRNILITTHR
jgi:hypothetical protein